MKKAVTFFVLFSLPFIAYAENLVQKNIFTKNEKVRTVVSTYSSSPTDPKYIQFNPFVFHDDTVIEDSMTFKGKPVYSTVYHTGKFGLRKTETADNAETHLLMAGDSNMFGVGVDDDQTLPSVLAKKFPAKKVVNFGLSGVGPNSTLFFLQNFSLLAVIGKAKKGTMVYDFHHHLIDRVIGSKLFLSWSKLAPRYALKGKKLVYAGVFEDYAPAKFYMFLNKLPWNNIFFPNLPRISHDHIVLTAKVIAEIKKQYLLQTTPHNRFVVTFNPAFKAKYARENLQDLQEALALEHVETSVFRADEIKPLPIIEGEYHQSALAHKNYSEMLIKKLNLTNE